MNEFRYPYRVPGPEPLSGTVFGGLAARRRKA